MKTLIRVQDDNGRGMFQAGVPDNTTSVYEIPELEPLAERHYSLPTAGQDKVIFNYLKDNVDGDIWEEWQAGKHPYRFAFKSITQFEKWVKREEVEILKRNGYRVIKIKVREFVESEYQALFNVNTVESIEDITELFID